MKVRYEYWQSEENGEWYFHLKAPNGGILVHSGAYPTEEACLEGVENVRRYAKTSIVVQPDITIY